MSCMRMELGCKVTRYVVAEGQVETRTTQSVGVQEWEKTPVQIRLAALIFPVNRQEYTCFILEEGQDLESSTGCRLKSGGLYAPTLELESTIPKSKRRLSFLRVAESVDIGEE